MGGQGGVEGGHGGAEAAEHVSGVTPSKAAAHVQHRHHVPRSRPGVKRHPGRGHCPTISRGVVGVGPDVECDADDRNAAARRMLQQARRSLGLAPIFGAQAALGGGNVEPQAQQGPAGGMVGGQLVNLTARVKRGEADAEVAGVTQLGEGMGGAWGCAWAGPPALDHGLHTMLILRPLTSGGGLQGWAYTTRAVGTPRPSTRSSSAADAQSNPAPRAARTRSRPGSGLHLTA